jgi:alkylated DNA nucleotide flippase Atl1
MGTGIFIAIAARAAEEDENEGRKDINPWWRTIKSKGKLNEKYPGGVEGQAARLKKEGHAIEPDRSGKPRKVKDWETKLVETKG